jgi:hypothetical protein
MFRAVVIFWGREKRIHGNFGDIVFLVGLGFELRACTCKASALLLKPHLQSILLWLFWRLGGGEGSIDLPRLESNHGLPDLSLPSS